MPTRPTLLLILVATLGLPACSGLDFGDNPPKAPPKADRSLTAAPTELVNGSAR